MKIALVVGHNKEQKGYYSPFLGQSEYDFYSNVAGLVSISSCSVKSFKRKYSTSGYSDEIRKVYAEVDAWNPDASIELHFNAASSLAHGCEVLSSGSKKSVLYANIALGVLSETWKPRRVIIAKRGNGSLALKSGRAPAILIEPFFGSNKEDCLTLGDSPEFFMAKILLKLIRKIKDGTTQ